MFHDYLELAGKLECPAGIMGIGTAPQQSLTVLTGLLALVVLPAKLDAANTSTGEAGLTPADVKALARCESSKVATIEVPEQCGVRFEIARFGGTSEDVAAGLRDGSFGMADETGREMNEAFIRGSREHQGMGEALARALDAADANGRLMHPELSVLLGAYRLDVPTTVHAALGAEIIHQHPAASGAAIGDTSHRDFRRLAHSLTNLDDGGVVLNLGSAVIMPEVFLKALTIARNLNEGRPRNFVSCDLDMQRHYRPRMNVVQRPTLESGKGYEITGHHELMVPLLAWAVVEKLSAV